MQSVQSIWTVVAAIFYYFDHGMNTFVAQLFTQKVKINKYAQLTGVM